MYSAPSLRIRNPIQAHAPISSVIIVIDLEHVYTHIDVRLCFLCVGRLQLIIIIPQ